MNQIKAEDLYKMSNAGIISTIINSKIDVSIWLNDYLLSPLCGINNDKERETRIMVFRNRYENWSAMNKFKDNFPIIESTRYVGCWKVMEPSMIMIINKCGDHSLGVSDYKGEEIYIDIFLDHVKILIKDGDDYKEISGVVKSYEKNGFVISLSNSENKLGINLMFLVKTA
jgi:hypothetical protein